MCQIDLKVASTITYLRLHTYYKILLGICASLVLNFPSDHFNSCWKSIKQKGAKCENLNFHNAIPLKDKRKD